MEFNNIYNVDCYKAIKELPDKSIDLIVTDPPYEICAGGGGGAFGREKRNYHEGVSFKLNYGVDNSILDEMVRVMKHINIYLWCNKNQLRQYLDYFDDLGCNMDVLVWCKTNPIPTCNNKYLSDIEYCVYAAEKGVGLGGSYDTKHKFYVSAINKKDKKLYGHPTIKPLDIIKNLIINSSHEGDVVLDPFIGSGTTAVAAKELNRKYVGFEIEEKWYNVAKARLEETTLPEKKENLSLFDFIEEVK